MDNYFQTYGYLGGPGFRSDDQTTDSYQSPDVFLNLEENKPQAKIEEQDEFIKNEWVTQENKDDEKIEFQNNPYEPKEQSKFSQQQQQQQQFNNMKPMPMNQKRSMKIKKEKAKIMASKKREQQRLAQQAMQQAQQQAQQQQQQAQQQTQSQPQTQTQQQQQQQQQQAQQQQQESQFQSGSQSPILKQEQDSDLTNETMLLEDKKSTQNMENKPDKSMLQKIRNRISAQNSRDRKKAYIQDLENKSKDYQLRNIQLQEQINQLMNENEQQKKENTELKRELLAIKKKYGECTDEYFQEPCINNKRAGGSIGFNNYGAFGFAILSLVSLIMVTNMNVKNTPSSILPKIGQEARTDLSRQLDLQQMETTFEKLDKQSNEYNQLKDIVDCGALIQEEESNNNNMLQNNNNTPLKQINITLKEEINIKQEEGDYSQQMEIVKPSEGIMKIEENNSIVKASDSEKLSNLRPCINCDKEVTSTGLSKISPRQNVSTIFCPQPYRYYPKSEMNVQEQQVYKNQEWLQLFLPKQELNAFSQEVDNIYVKRNSQESQKKIVEVWAKVHSVKEIEHKEMKRV